MFLTIVLATGPIWAKPVWFVWWTWSPRLTSSLVLWMLYVAYLLVRNYVPDPDRRAMMSAVFGIVAFVDAPIVWFSIRWWRDIHPSPMVETGGLSPAMRPALWTCVAVFMILFVYLLRRRFFLEQARLERRLAGAPRRPRAVTSSLENTSDEYHELPLRGLHRNLGDTCNLSILDPLPRKETPGRSRTPEANSR